MEHKFVVIDFFFQAEDGIRDRNVTGVQTCALPIYIALLDERQNNSHQTHGLSARRRTNGSFDDLLSRKHPFVSRSEERRVGKECRSQGWMGHETTGGKD